MLDYNKTNWLKRVVARSGNCTLAPVAVETLGAWGPSALELCKEIGGRIARCFGYTRSTAFLRQRLSIAVQSGNAAAVLGTLPQEAASVCQMAVQPWSISNWTILWSLLNRVPFSAPVCNVVRLYPCRFAHSTRFWQFTLTFKQIKRSSFAKLPLGKRPRSEVDQSLNFKTQIEAIARKARARCSIFLKSYITRDAKMMKNFFITFVLPILEANLVVWSPVSMEGRLLIKSKGCRDGFLAKFKVSKQLMMRLSNLELNNLYFRRIISDLIYVCKIFTGLSRCNFHSHINFRISSSTRGHT